ncbi:DEKNAAC100556 [Brettanomyces naardenensis]|uniref:glutamate-5-semialdehyde dehydrogenase n=1 Tax=Brettanomyces naardenensis TaxID=13370 RepID=A0A448YF83_BRENA|nr:DEKNAAC100556 [Brettanomyces naardenensis]
MAEQLAKDAHFAATILKTLSDTERSDALSKIREGLLQAKDSILEANKQDLLLADQGGLSSALIKRLDLSKNDKFDSMCDGILDVAKLEDPLNKVTLARELDEGLNLYRVTCPVGVLLIIFESRPEVIANITALAIKSGNAAILKGGKESLHTFKAMAEVIDHVLDTKTRVPSNAIQLISTRGEVSDLLVQDRYIDLVIPRGSNQLVRSIKDNTKIPVLGHADGICSIYVDEFADIEKAKRIIVDAKTNYPAGCNAVETLLINDKIVHSPSYVSILESLASNGVTSHLVPELLSSLPKVLKEKYEKLFVEAKESDFHHEFLSLDIAVKPVSDVKAAVGHINRHSSKHTDAIITENDDNAKIFLNGVDSSGVYWNCSTRFADGFRYGFGTEVGISTNKIHARGPVGLEGLVCYYYQLRGNGQIVGDYQGGGGKRAFIHKDLDVKGIVL